MDLLSVRLNDGGGGGGAVAAAAVEIRVRNSMYTWVKFATSAQL